MHRCIQRPCYGYNFLDGAAYAVPFLPHMKGYGYIGSAQRSKALYQLLNGQEALRSIAKAQGHPKSARRKLPLKHRMKPCEITLIRMTAAIAQNAGPYGAAACEHADIQRNGCTFKAGQISICGAGIRHRMHIPKHGTQISLKAAAFLHRGRSHAAVAVYYSGKALHKLRLAKARAECRHICMAVYVDKARRYALATGIYDLSCFGIYIAYLSYLSVCNRNIAYKWSVYPIVYVSVFYKNIHHAKSTFLPLILIP